MRFLSVSILVLALTGMSSVGADLPHLITTIYCDTIQTEFGWEIIPLGDQNGDGYDDFLTIESRAKSYIYYGGNPGDSLPHLVFLKTRPFEKNIGDYDGDGYDDFVIPNSFYDVDHTRNSLFWGGPLCDTTPEHSFGTYTTPCEGPIALGHDINANGSYELITGDKPPIGGNRILWYELSDPPDSNPSVVLYPDTVYGAGYSFGDVVLSADINGNGYDDLAVNLRHQLQYDVPGQVNLYWGDPEFDSVSDMILRRPGGNPAGAYEFGTDAAVLGDINGDGYNDLYVGNRYSHADSMRCIYFGGPDMDTIPDIILPFTDVCDKGLPAGDVNNDGYVDLMTGFTSPYSWLGWVKIYYGGPDMDSIADVTIDVNAMPGYHNNFALGFGPLGDYNGDGIDDFGIASYASASAQVIYIFSGWDEALDVDDDPPPGLPHSFVLHQNYPNPLNPSTEIRFSLTRRAHARLEVFDPTGRLVTTLLDRTLGAGEHTATWDGTDYASGVYLYRLTVGDKSDSKKMVLVK